MAYARSGGCLRLVRADVYRWCGLGLASQNTLVNEALTRNRDGPLFLRLDWGIRKLWVLHWFGWSSVGYVERRHSPLMGGSSPICPTVCRLRWLAPPHKLHSDSS